MSTVSSRGLGAVGSSREGPGNAHQLALTVAQFTRQRVGDCIEMHRFEGPVDLVEIPVRMAARRNEIAEEVEPTRSLRCCHQVVAHRQVLEQLE